MTFVFYRNIGTEKL